MPGENKTQTWVKPDEWLWWQHIKWSSSQWTLGLASEKSFWTFIMTKVQRLYVKTHLYTGEK